MEKTKQQNLRNSKISDAYFAQKFPKPIEF